MKLGFKLLIAPLLTAAVALGASALYAVLDYREGVAMRVADAEDTSNLKTVDKTQEDLLFTASGLSAGNIMVSAPYSGPGGATLALSLAVFTYNLATLFCRHLGWLERVSVTTLRYRLFGCAGIISRAQNRTTLKLGIPPPQRSWWQQIWEKLLSPLPNCNAVAQSP